MDNERPFALPNHYAIKCPNDGLFLSLSRTGNDGLVASVTTEERFISDALDQEGRVRLDPKRGKTYN